MEEYYNFLKLFSKKNSNILSLHEKYNNKIILKEQQKYGHVLLYKISFQKLDIVTCYLDSHLIKEFI